ncbi:MAG TPA: hypothetical protein VEU51_04190 [Candidatus Acidoferrales bacterium]|nr:hypothetical protein [Candidatus Acidoferrales bacterium]
MTTTSLATAPFHGWAVELRNDRVQAHGTTGAEAAAFTTLSFSKEFSELWGIGGGFGTARSLGTGGLIGSIQAHLELFRTSISPSIARNMLVSSSQALHANLMETDFGLAISHELENGFSIEGDVHRKYLSDGNRSDEVEFSPTYSFDLRGTKLALGYHFSYLAFATNPENGYWSPRRALSNELTAAWTFDWLRTYGGLELSAGRDSVREQGVSNVGPGGGFGGSVGTSLGFRLDKGLSVDLNWSMEGSATWHSMLSGIALRYVF